MRRRHVKLDSLKAQVPYAFVGGPFGSNLTTRDYTEDGVPVIRGSNLSTDGAFHDEGFVFVSDNLWDASRPPTPSIASFGCGVGPTMTSSIGRDSPGAAN